MKNNKQPSIIYPIIGLLFLIITMCHIPKFKQKINDNVEKSERGNHR